MVPARCEDGLRDQFNRVFPKQGEIRSSKEILKDIAIIEEKMARLESENYPLICKWGMTVERAVTDCKIAWIGSIPSKWHVVRLAVCSHIAAGYPFDAEKFNPTKGFPLVRIETCRAVRYRLSLTVNG